MTQVALIVLILRKMDKALFSILGRQAHIRSVIGKVQLLLIIFFLYGCATSPVSIAPPPNNIPLTDELFPALGLSSNIFNDSKPIAITSNADNLLMAIGYVRFTGEVFVFKNFDYSKPVTIIKVAEFANPKSLEFAPNRQEMMTVGPDLQIWDTETWEKTSQLEGISKAIYIPDGNGILAIHEQEIQRLDSRNLKTLWTIPLPSKAVMTAMTISPDSRKIAIASGQAVREIEVQDGKEICETTRLATNCTDYTISHLQYTSDSTKLLAGLRACAQTQTDSGNTRLLLLDSGTLSLQRNMV